MSGNFLIIAQRGIFIIFFMSARSRLASLSHHLSSSSTPNQFGSVVDTSEVCGIIGYVGNGTAANYVIDGLRILENRGYDSAGITTISTDKRLVCTKYASNDTTSDAMIKLAQVAPSMIFFLLFNDIFSYFIHFYLLLFK